jgi:hypothetical protein
MKISEIIKMENTFNAPVKQMTDAQLEEYLIRVRNLYVAITKTG